PAKQTTQTASQDVPAKTTAADGLTAAVVSTPSVASTSSAATAATAATKTVVTTAGVKEGTAYLDYVQGGSGIDYDFGDNAR
ncbi:hypothetical protein, partial [Bacteroides sp. 51]|uniref:hypothetical protein n=1 Tax=Bacteroides sp. 51 TaxID=2302938 RepID=UPI00194038B0